MKNLFLISVILMCVQLNVFSEKSEKFHYGPKFGLDISSTEINKESLLNELKENYQAGIFLKFGKKIYLQPEIYFSSYKNSGSNLNFVKAPVMVGLNILDLGLLSLHLNVGPSFSKLLSNNSTETFPLVNWQIGAGANFLGFITTDIRYTLPNGTENVPVQLEQVIRNGGLLNLTIGLIL